MSRERKFRAWDRKNKKMIYEENFGDGEKENEGFTKLVQDGGEVFLISIYANGDCKYESVSDNELMQFAEEKDKNSREIYEGDIIKADGIFEVLWHCGGFCMIRRLPYKPKTDLDQMEWYLPHSIGNMGYEKEVIGNIYENPEMIIGE